MSALRCAWRLPYGAEAYLNKVGVTLDLQDNPLVPHTHPVSAILRNWAELLLINRFHGKRIKSVGGNDVRHARDHSWAQIHSCCPLLDGQDHIREAKRAGKKRGDHCHNKFQDCLVPADVYLFSHSLYYISRDQLSCIPSGCHIAACHNVYPGPGTYTFAESTVTETNGILTVYTRGNDHPYTHPPVWLKSECVISTGYTTIAFTSIFRADVLHAYVGVVKPASLFDHLCEPVDVPHEPPTTELVEHLVPEFSGVSITARLLHTGQMRARTFFTTRDLPIPPDVDDQVLLALQKGMAITERTWSAIPASRVRVVNDMIADLKQAERGTTIWSRYKYIVWSVGGGITSVIAYTMPLSLEQMRTLYTHTAAKLVGGLGRFLSSFSHVRLKAARWFESRWFPVPTYIPANCYENEITSIMTRSLPPKRDISIHPNIRVAAEILAQKIGKVDRPMDFDTWVARFRPARQLQLRAARLCPLQTTVEFFQKIEQLDEAKQPRAIQARVDAFKAHLGPWIAAFELQCRERLPIFIKGLDPQQKAAKIEELSQMSDLALEIDFSRFDRSLNAELLRNTEHVVYKHCLPPAVARAMTLQLRNYVKTRNNAAYLVDGTRMSGDVNTSIGNCVVNAILMRALGLSLGRLIAEGDDMLAAVTPKNIERLDMTLLTRAGLTPEYKIIPMNEAEFCSRRLIRTSLGVRVCRDPRREIRRTGFSIHGETEADKIYRGCHEWEGIPMFGPLYQQAASIPVTPISAEAREDFARHWGICHDDQQRFETDADFRADFAQEVAAPLAPSTGDRYRAVPRTARLRETRDTTVPVCTGVKRVSAPGCPRPDVRDVPAEGTSEGTVQSCSGHNDKRRSANRRRLRRERRRADLQWDSGVEPKSDESRVARLHSERAPQPSNETTMAGNGR